MKKSKVKLKLNKKNISNLKTNTISGGATGVYCEFTNKYYNTCILGCPLPTWWNCNYTKHCANTNLVCDQ